MHNTGIVRRIDGLGRIVIPKEIRKTLRIKEGDPLEIFANKDELVFKKYSPISSAYECAESVAKGISELLGKECVVVDKHTVLFSSNARLKDCVGKRITNELGRIIEGKRGAILSNCEGNDTCQICRGETRNFENQLIVPILLNQDCFGAIIVFDNDKTSRFNSSDAKIVSLGAKVISKQC